LQKVQNLSTGCGYLLQPEAKS